MAKAADLRQAMSASAKTAPRRDQPVVVESARPARASEDNPHYRPGRANKSNVTGYFPGEVKKQLRLLAAERETTIQRLLAEALNDLFAKNGKPEIVPLEDN